MTVKCPNPQCGKGLNILPNVAKKGKVKCAHCGMMFNVKHVNPASSSGTSSGESSQPQKPKTPEKPQQTPTNSEEGGVYVVKSDEGDDDEYLI